MLYTSHQHLLDSLPGEIHPHDGELWTSARLNQANAWFAANGVVGRWFETPVTLGERDSGLPNVYDGSYPLVVVWYAEHSGQPYLLRVSGVVSAEVAASVGGLSAGRELTISGTIALVNFWHTSWPQKSPTSFGLTLSDVTLARVGQVPTAATEPANGYDDTSRFCHPPTSNR